MRIKSYFSATVEAAISEARRELGPDAVLVSTRSAAPEARHLGRYEVVFGSLGNSANMADSAIEERPGQTAQRSPMMDEISELRKQIQELCQSVNQNSGAGPSRPIVFDRFRSCLIENGIPAEQATIVVEGASKRLPPADGAGQVPPESALRRAVAAELESRISITGGLPPLRQQRNVIAFVGPSGAGKTDSLAKLAVLEGFAKNRPVRLLTTDCERVAAAARLNCFATILGVPLQTCESPAILEGALQRKHERELVLIDTAGYSPAELPTASDLGQTFRATKDIHTVLVLSATMKAEDLNAANQRFSIFGPQELLFTHMDETQSFGSLWSAAASSKLPVSFLGTGQQVPDDLEIATLGKVSFLLLRGKKESVSNAA